MTSTTIRLSESDRTELVSAVQELRSALRQAGIQGLDPDIGPHGPLIGLNALNVREAGALARLIRAGMRRTFKVTEQLGRAFLAHKLEVPAPKVHGGRIVLGEVSVATAAQLAILLGAPRDEVEAGAEATGCVAVWAHHVRVRDLLADSYKAVTGFVLGHVYAHPDCIRCSHEPSIELGSIDVEAARRLLAALRAAVP